MAEAYHNEALRKQRIVDNKFAALARIKYSKVREPGILEKFQLKFELKKDHRFFGFCTVTLRFLHFTLKCF